LIGVRPNRLFAGTAWSNVENAITHPTCVADLHAGMFLKSPPMPLPFFTSTFPPIKMADTSRLRTAGLRSTSSAISWRRTNEPCEWPIRTNPRPWLYF
jgi:hypothetical protein